jgi:hypothetical protein
VVNALQKQYDNRGKQTIFLEHDVDNRSGLRNNLWWIAAAASGSQTTPFIIVDSGYKYINGSVDFQKKYAELVDAALKNPAGADLAAFYARRKDTFFIHVDVTNRLRTPLGYDNEARIDVLLYEDTQVIHVDHFVRQIVRQTIDEDIPRNGTASFDIQMNVDPATRTNYSKAHVLVILDYKPDGSRAFNSVQAVMGIEGLPTATPEAPPTVPPTATLVPTDEPTATEVPTEEPTATEVPTAVPTPVRPVIGPVYLPYLLR